MPGASIIYQIKQRNRSCQYWDGESLLKILVIYQYYIMPMGAGGSRFDEFARVWTEQGHEVTVVAGNLDHNTGKVPEAYRNKPFVVEMDGAVRVIRCYVPPSYGKSYKGRMLGFAGFTISAIAGLALVKRPDVIIATSPPLITPIPGWVAGRLRWSRVPWVFEVRDLWPESAVTTGVLDKNSLITRALYQLEKMAYAWSDKINVLTPAFRADILKRGLAEESKIVFIPNGADVNAFVPGPRDNDVRRNLGWGDKLVVMYAGAHGKANAIGQLVEVAERLRGRNDILIASVGDGPERKVWQAEATTRGLNNIVFYGAQPKQRMPEFVNACDVGAAVLQNNPTFRTVYPNKVFDYMSCERPVLLAIDGVARTLVCEEAKAGVFARPEDPEDIAARIVELADSAGLRADLGRSGRQWVLANATRETLAKKYLAVLQELVDRSKD